MGLRDLKDSQQLIFISHVNASNQSFLEIIVRMMILGPDLVVEGAGTFVGREKLCLSHIGAPFRVPWHWVL